MTDSNHIQELAVQLGSLKPEQRAPALERATASAALLQSVGEAAVANVNAGLAAVKGTSVPSDLDQKLLALGTLAGAWPAASETLRATAGHEVAGVRELVATWGRGPAMPAILVGLLDDAAPGVLTAVRRKLGDTPTDGAVPKVLALAKAATPASKGDWLEVLGGCAALSPEHAAVVAGYLMDEARGDLPAAAGALVGLVRLGPSAASQRDGLLALAGESEPRKRLWARAALVAAGLDVDANLVALVDALASGNEDEHASAATAMRELSPAVEVAALEAGLARLDGAPRARVLGRLTSQNQLMPLFAYEQVLTFLDDPSAPMRAAAVDAVARYVGRRRGGSPLAALTPEVRARVEKLAGDADAEVRDAVARTVKKLG